MDQLAATCDYIISLHPLVSCCCGLHVSVSRDNYAYLLSFLPLYRTVAWTIQKLAQFLVVTGVAGAVLYLL